MPCKNSHGLPELHCSWEFGGEKGEGFIASLYDQSTCFKPTNCRVDSCGFHTMIDRLLCLARTAMACPNCIAIGGLGGRKGKRSLPAFTTSQAALSQPIAGLALVAFTQRLTGCFALQKLPWLAQPALHLGVMGGERGRVHCQLARPVKLLQANQFQGWLLWLSHND